MVVVGRPIQEQVAGDSFTDESESLREPKRRGVVRVDACGNAVQEQLVEAVPKRRTQRFEHESLPPPFGCKVVAHLCTTMCG